VTPTLGNAKRSRSHQPSENPELVPLSPKTPRGKKQKSFGLSYRGKVPHKPIPGKPLPTRTIATNAQHLKRRPQRRVIAGRIVGVMETLTLPVKTLSSSLKIGPVAYGPSSGERLMHFVETLTEEHYHRKISLTCESGVRAFINADVHGSGKADLLLGRSERNRKGSWC